MDSIEVYGFEDAKGSGSTFTTRDIAEARRFARENNLKLIAYIYEFSDSEVIEDNTEPATVDLALAYIGDGYLAEVMTSEDYEDTSWTHDVMADEDFAEAFASDVPRDIAENLLKQGTSEQVYSDGYEAASAVAPYLKD